MINIELGGRKIPLVFTVLEMKEMQEQIAPIGELHYALFAINKDDRKDQSQYGTPGHLNTIAKAIRILGNAGLEETGQEPDLTERKIMRALRPSKLTDTLKAIMNAITEDMESEIPEEESKEPVDVTLEEINRKKKKDS